MTFGGGFDEAILDEVQRELGVTLEWETMGDGYFDRLEAEPPQMWTLDWVADYPGRNDFLGVLLNTGASSNYGRWSSADFDAAIAEAGSAIDPDAASAAYDRAEAIIRDEVPVVPSGLRHRLGAVAERSAWCDAERARDRPDGRAGVGGMRSNAGGAGRMQVRLAGVVLLAALALASAPPALADDLAVFGKPTAVSSFTAGVDFRQPVTIDRPLARAELLLTIADAIGTTVIPVAGPAGSGASRPDLPLRSGRRRRLVPNTQMVARWRLVVGRRPDARVGRAGVRRDVSRTTGSTGRPPPATSSASTGTRARRRSASGRCGSARTRWRGVRPARRDRDRTDRFLRLRRPGGVLRCARTGDPRERRRRADPRASGRMFALIPPSQIDDAWVGHRDSARADPSRLRYGGAATRTTSRRAGSTRAWRSTRARGTRRPIARRSKAPRRRHADSARWPDRPVPDGVSVSIWPTRRACRPSTTWSGRTARTPSCRSSGPMPMDVPTTRPSADALGVDMSAFGAAWLDDLGAAAPTRYGPQPAPTGPVPDAWLGDPEAPAPPAATPAPGATPRWRRGPLRRRPAPSRQRTRKGSRADRCSCWSWPPGCWCSSLS